MQAKKHTPSKDNEENGDPKAKPQESGKEKLLDLLGSMKVEVTSKRKLQSLKGQISKDQKRISVESLESATSMFQEAASENKDPKDIIADMKIGKQANNARFAARPANQIHFDDDGHGYIHEKEKNSDFTGVKRRFDLFQGKRLSIFQVPLEIKHPDKKEAPVLSLWDVELAKQIAAVVQHVPRNGFEEMIQWTREGKLWQYPIDNEAGSYRHHSKFTIPGHPFFSKRILVIVQLLKRSVACGWGSYPAGTPKRTGGGLASPPDHKGATALVALGTTGAGLRSSNLWGPVVTTRGHPGAWRALELSTSAPSRSAGEEEDRGHPECFRVHSRCFHHTGACRQKVTGGHLEHIRVAIKGAASLHSMAGVG
ncbi:RT31 protein, partial [Polypterus senegalus]